MCNTYQSVKTNPWKEGVYLDCGLVAVEIVAEVPGEEARLKAGALRKAIFNRASFSNSGRVNFH
jgi:hypothetical protein